ncbi:MAG: GNAT family N-acetyltransferase [Solirubrobacteraceae bacterium]
MRRLLSDGFELDDDRARIDVDAVHAFISTQSYWGLGRERALVVQAIEGSTRVVGLYLDDGSQGGQVGFARAVSDGTSVAYLADVYVLPVHRGRGLGLELVREMVERSFEGVRWMLHTADAQPLYAKLGFVEGDPPYPLMERPPTRGTAPATARR